MRVAAHTPEKPYLLYPPLKVDHPDWLVGDHVKRSRQGRWSSVDYACPEIRELAFRFASPALRPFAASLISAISQNRIRLSRWLRLRADFPVAAAECPHRNCAVGRK